MEPSGKVTRLFCAEIAIAVLPVAAPPCFGAGSAPHAARDPTTAACRPSRRRRGVPRRCPVLTIDVTLGLHL
jgi:hypothetical protein